MFLCIYFQALPKVLEWAWKRRIYVSHFCLPPITLPYTIKRYKESIRAELNRHLRSEFEKRTSAELTQAVPPTETLNSEAAKEKAGLARQGSLAERQPPASLVLKRQQMQYQAQTSEVNSDVPMVEDDPNEVRH